MPEEVILRGKEVLLRRFIPICLTIVLGLIAVKIESLPALVVAGCIGIGSFFTAEMGLWAIFPCGIIVYVANIWWGESQDFLYLSIIGVVVGILLGLGIRKMIEEKV